MTAVAGAEAAPRTDVLVQVQLTPLEWAGGKMTALSHPIADTRSGPQLNARRAGQMILHEAAFFVEQPGRYQVQVAVVDAAGESGTASFPITVVTIPAWFKGFIYVQLAIGTLVGLLLLRQGQRLWLGHTHRSRTTAKVPTGAN